MKAVEGKWNISCCPPAPQDPKFPDVLHDLIKGKDSKPWKNADIGLFF